VHSLVSNRPPALDPTGAKTLGLTSDCTKVGLAGHYRIVLRCDKSGGYPSGVICEDPEAPQRINTLCAIRVV
jgi:hypothetical protein